MFKKLFHTAIFSIREQKAIHFYSDRLHSGVDLKISTPRNKQESKRSVLWLPSIVTVTFCYRPELRWKGSCSVKLFAMNCFAFFKHLHLDVHYIIYYFQDYYLTLQGRYFHRTYPPFLTLWISIITLIFCNNYKIYWNLFPNYIHYF